MKVFVTGGAGFIGSHLVASLLKENKVIELIDSKPKDKELILTGSHIPFQKIFDKADLVTEVRKIKHPYDNGIMARKGLEY